MTTYKSVAVCPYCGAVADKTYIGKLCVSCHHGIMKEQS
jgi:hypothetical protein